jgi:hypothetical protein
MLNFGIFFTHCSRARYIEGNSILALTMGKFDLVQAGVAASTRRLEACLISVPHVYSAGPSSTSKILTEQCKENVPGSTNP